MPEKMFKITREGVLRRISEIEENLVNAKNDLTGLDSLRDGDMMDDPLMHALLEKREMLSRELTRLRGFLGPDTEVIEYPESGEGAVVSLGHQVRLKIDYADGFSDEFTVTIGTTLDKQHLQQLQIYNKYFDETTSMLISDGTPLARSILGLKVKQTAKFESNGQINKVKLISIETSPIFNEG